MSTVQPIAAPSTEDIIAAFAQALLPLAGPVGIAVDSVLPAVQQLYDMLTGHPTANLTLNDLSGIISGGDSALAKLIADNNAAKSAAAVPVAGPTTPTP